MISRGINSLSASPRFHYWQQVAIGKSVSRVPLALFTLLPSAIGVRFAPDIIMKKAPARAEAVIMVNHRRPSSNTFDLLEHIELMDLKLGELGLVVDIESENCDV